MRQCSTAAKMLALIVPRNLNSLYLRRRSIIFKVGLGFYTNKCSNLCIFANVLPKPGSKSEGPCQCLARAYGGRIEEDKYCELDVGEWKPFHFLKKVLEMYYLFLFLNQWNLRILLKAHLQTMEFEVMDIHLSWYFLLMVHCQKANYPFQIPISSNMIWGTAAIVRCWE